MWNAIARSQPDHHDKTPYKNTFLQHDDHEYGAEIGTDGQHSGGPFFIDVSPTMRVEDVRLTIQASPPTPPLKPPVHWLRAKRTWRHLNHTQHLGLLFLSCATGQYNAPRAICCSQAPTAVSGSQAPRAVCCSHAQQSLWCSLVP